MSNDETVAEPKTEFNCTPNMQLKNKYAVGDKVWAIFSIGPDIKIGQYTVRSLNAEIIGYDEPAYIYGFNIAGDGSEEGVNLTFIKESLIFFDRTEAEKKTAQMVAELLAEYDKEEANMTKKFEESMRALREERNKVNNNNLEVVGAKTEAAETSADDPGEGLPQENATEENVPQETEIPEDENKEQSNPETNAETTTEREKTETDNGEEEEL